MKSNKFNINFLIRKIAQNLIMFILGASFYTLIEIMFRNRSYRLMSLLGGIIFIIGGNLNNIFSWKMDLILQCGVISLVTTAFEAIVGNIDYYFLHLDMWDYTTLPLHALNGKISLQFSILWFLLGFIIVFVYDAITYYWMHEGEQPRYYIFEKEIWRMSERNCH